MDVNGHAAIVTGGASGLGAATARMLADKGAKVTILDLNEELGVALAEEIGSVFAACDVADEASVQNALDAGKAAHGAARILVNCAGIGFASRIVGRKGAHDFGLFTKVVTVNLIGTFNVTRLFAVDATQLDPLEDNERGVVIMTASVAAFDGQIGQAAYAASKGGIHSMTLPMAREFADRGVRVCTIAPGILKTPLMDILPEEVQQSLGDSIPFPRRLGHAEEYASLSMHIFENAYLNGETIRLDGAIRMAAK
ncbi:MAG: SDR family NAD(P)-dependent oxidoreductase [Rhodospirillaceae bacterium]|jgi:NAD(P)-dependent dehydrogenase (short-subunit alcohol dehydrogenase family)|nr:SDR family NAD(P)-dependent oxidoreductase [Rhodospirillaceae bacterium]MBT4939080.1 SDR family NAD(P)-dependent oxidoreductase [Rhodospirillaceae bacterium]MBT5940524.1 SDR family NAD(P)-dependent oxidoreductase [Rhodospirillaceae bacterium]MBT7268805.1 SDR family NAD(P)-dependent oxidoreductase [Rhodospirillaceae bacterium]